MDAFLKKLQKKSLKSSVHKAEVSDMCITEYDEAETLKAIGQHIKLCSAKW